MIQPVRPVDGSICPPGALPCSLRFRLACALTFRTLYGSWFFPSAALEPPRQPSTTEPPSACRPDGRLEWQPWPSTLSKVAQPGRWWPGNELPPIPPAPLDPHVIVPILVPAPGHGRLEWWA